MSRRPTSTEIDESILDSAASFFARRGVKETAIQAIADDVAYSKAAVLQRFGTKALLLERVIARCAQLSDDLVASVADLPPGSARDELAVARLTDIALANPGFVAMLIGAATNQRGTELAVGMERVGQTALRAFGIEDWDSPARDVDRIVRVAGCLGAVSVLASVYQGYLSRDVVRPRIIAAAFGALHGPAPTGGY